MLSSRRKAFLPCPLPASRSTTSFSQPPPDCFVLLGPGDPGGGGRVQQRQLPGLRRPFPDWRPGATFITCSAAELPKFFSCSWFFLAATPPSSTPATPPVSRAGLQGSKPSHPNSLRHSSSSFSAQAQHLPRVQADPCN